MKDIDFDELDRAVNSLIGGVPSTPAAPTTPASTPAESSSVPAAPLAQTPAAPDPTPQPLASRRTSGRFMDVVHPSSDMRSSAPVAPVTPVSRTAAPLEPTSPLSVPARPTDTPAAPALATAPESTAPKPSNEWPDPLDFHGNNGEAQSAPVAVTPAAAPVQAPMVTTTDDEDSDIAKIADDINATLTKDSQKPLETPFLSDANVEKRPLNALAADTALTTAVMSTDPPAPTPPVIPEIQPVTTPSPTAETPQSGEKSEEHPIETDTPLPAELQSDLLNIESNETAAASVPVSQFTPPAAPSTDVPTGPTSIVQQYKESPSTGDQPAAALFDTAAYKKPQAKAKKKSSWLVILWIFLLLVVGGGIGAAVYFFVLPLI